MLSSPSLCRWMLIFLSRLRNQILTFRYPLIGSMTEVKKKDSQLGYEIARARGEERTSLPWNRIRISKKDRIYVLWIGFYLTTDRSKIGGE